MFFSLKVKESEKETGFIDKLICISVTNIMILMAQEHGMILHKAEEVL
jgi:hypothetical protein